MTNVFIVRHAEAEGNIFRRIHGHSDGKVTLTGKRQIDALKERFSGVALDAVYSSDLTRAYETALGIGSAVKLPVVKLQSLREISMGAWEDTCWGWWETHAPELAEYYNLAPLKWRVDGAETIGEVQERMVRTVTELAERHDGGSIAVVTHGVALRTLLCHASGVSLDDVNEIRYCDNTAVSLLAIDGGKMTLTYMNDNSHLPEEISTFAKQRWWKNKNITDKRNLYFEPLKWDESGVSYLKSVYSDPDSGFSDPAQNEIESFMSAQKSKAENNPECLLYAMHYGKPCGLVILSPDGWVRLFYLEPEYRGKGFAVQLLGVAVSTFRKSGLSRIRLTVAESNRAAIKFYSRYGFSGVSELDETINGAAYLAYELAI
jgi:probable phosphoglycerate mutase